MDIKFFGGDKDSGEVFAVETRAEAGYLLESHVHKHGHLSILAEGTADVEVGGHVTRMKGPCTVTIPPDTQHRVQAVTDIVWYCLWADYLADKQQAQDSLRLVPA